MPEYFPRLEDCPRHRIFPGVELTSCWGEKLMLSLVDLEPHAVVEEHRHPHEQMGMLIRGRAIFTIGGVSRELGPGERYWMPSNVPHKVVALDQPVQALDVFTPPREDYR